MRKIIIAVIFIALSVLTVTSAVNAAMGDIKFDTLGCTTPPVQDGNVTQAEYGGNAPIVLDGSGKNTEGTWAGTNWDKELLKFYFTWDAQNLYVGLTVEGDSTESQANCPKTPQDGSVCPFGKCDSIQLGFNPGNIITGQHPIIFCVGFTANGQPYVHADAYRSTTDGKQALDYTDKIKGFCTKYSPTGFNYQLELVLPWSEICVKGAGRSSEGAKVFDCSGELAKIKAGYVMPIFLVYTDNDLATGKNIYIRTDATTGAEWIAEKMNSVALVLRDAPVAETAAAKPAAGGAAPAAAQTFDCMGIILAAAAISGGMTALSIRKRK